MHICDNIYLIPLFQLSPSAKVFRWFKLTPTQTHPLSRPESGFVDGEKSQKDEDDDCFKVDGVFDEEGILEGSQSLLESLGTRKRKKLLKLQLGRMTTFWCKKKKKIFLLSILLLLLVVVLFRWRTRTAFYYYYYYL